MAKSKQEKIKLSEPDNVNEYMSKLKHPLIKVVEALRKIILAADPQVGEEIKWNAPAFFYTGEMKPFDPKEYKRHIIVFNVAKKDCIRLVFPSGAKLNDASGLLEGNYTDGRRLAQFADLKEIRVSEKQLQQLVQRWIGMIDK